MIVDMAALMVPAAGDRLLLSYVTGTPTNGDLVLFPTNGVGLFCDPSQ